MTVAVEAKNVHKAYRDGDREVPVLGGVNLVISPGEVVAVIGPSGSGKSTLLHLLGTLDRPDTGSIEIGGADVALLGDRELARFRNRSLGFVFQFHQLLPDFTALENAMMPGRIAREEGEKTRRRALQLFSEVGLDHRCDHFPSQLSGGERQRVALCRALLLEPPLLLADEPTGNLDSKSGEAVLGRLLGLQESHGTTVVLVTHNPEVAARCDRILTLEGGILRP